MSAQLLQQITFYFFAFALLASACLVIFSRNPVNSALYLVCCFFNSAVLWMLLNAEFLALVLIFVYVGAVMTLFLFVVMMLNLKKSALKSIQARCLPLAMIILALFVGTIILALWPSHLSGLVDQQMTNNYSNIKALGVIIYTHYLYVFELAGMLLLMAIIGAVVLVHGEGLNRKKSQSINQQVNVKRDQRVRLVNLSNEKGED